MHENFVMKRSCLLFLLVLPAVIMAQEREKIKKTIRDNGVTRKQVYEVLKSDKTMMDGYWQSNTENLFKETGFYKTGLKDSTWSVIKDNKLLARKYYTGGQRTGRWVFYNYKEAPEWYYDFNEKKAVFLTSNTIDTSDYVYQDTNGNWVTGKLDINPIALNSTGYWIMFMLSQLHYPEAAQRNRETGNVIVKMVVNEDGKVDNWKIENTQFELLANEALRLVKAFEFDFVPAEKDGRKVKCEVMVTISFRQE